MPFEIEVKKNAFAGATFYLDESVMKYDGKEINTRNITGFGYMQTQTSVNGIKTSKTFEISLWQGEETRPTTFRFMGAFGGGAANDKYQTITDQIWNYFGDRMLNQLHKDLLQGKVYEINSNIKLISKGIVVRRKPLFKPAYELLIEWPEASSSTFQATLTIKSKSNRKAKLFETFSGRNIWLMYYYYNWLAKTPDAVSALLATPNNYQLIAKS
jgi:hypothetical protein